MSIITTFPNLMYDELRLVRQDHEPMTDIYEAYSCLEELLYEFLDASKTKNIDHARSPLLIALVHIATMCWRAAIDLELM